MKYHNGLSSSERSCKRKQNKTLTYLGMEILDAAPKPEHRSVCTQMPSEGGAMDRVSLSEDRLIVFI